MQNKIEQMYTTGEYLKNNPTWDSGDAVWKSAQLYEMLRKHNLTNKKYWGEVGAGSGEILINMSKRVDDDARFIGYDISPQAIEMAEKNVEKEDKDKFKFKLMSVPEEKSDILICADVFEHISDEFNFLMKIKDFGEYKIFNIPLDLSVYNQRKCNTCTKKKSWTY